MAAKIFRINYKSDFILTMNSEAGWTIPFCIKFWTSIPMRAYYVGFDGTTYTHCAYDPAEPTKLLVQFDDHHLPIGNLHFQIAYHFTVEDFPNNTEDEVFNATAITTEIDGETYQVMLDFTGETAPGIDFNMPSVGVTSVNGKIGAVTLNAQDVGAQPTIEDLATIRSGAAAGATAVQPTTLQEGLATKQNVIDDLATIRSGATAGATAVQPATLQEGLATKQDVISDLATIRNGAAAGATAVQPAGLTPIQTALQTIEAVIPSAATAQNQLADKNFVNSSISTNTANFVGTYNSLAELQAVQNPTNNDYGFVIETDEQGNEYYDRYKYVAASQQWLFEYKVESTPFTAAQWAAIQSGITSALVTKLNALPTNAELQQTLDGKADATDIPTALSQLSQDSTHRVVTDAEKSTWNGKQNAIEDLSTIRSGAAAGATAYQKPGTGIPNTDLASAVQTSLERADEAAVRPYNTQSPDGMGYLVLDKDATFASQVTAANTIYEIRYDYDLNAQTVTLPANCVLKFNGGSLSNGKLISQATQFKNMSGVLNSIVLSEALENWCEIVLDDNYTCLFKGFHRVSLRTDITISGVHDYVMWKDETPFAFYLKGNGHKITIDSNVRFIADKLFLSDVHVISSVVGVYFYFYATPLDSRGGANVNCTNCSFTNVGIHGSYHTLNYINCTFSNCRQVYGWQAILNGCMRNFIGCSFVAGTLNQTQNYAFVQVSFNGWDGKTLFEGCSFAGNIGMNSDWIDTYDGCNITISNCHFYSSKHIGGEGLINIKSHSKANVSQSGWLDTSGSKYNAIVTGCIFTIDLAETEAAPENVCGIIRYNSRSRSASTADDDFYLRYGALISNNIFTFKGTSRGAHLSSGTTVYPVIESIQGCKNLMVADNIINAEFVSNDPTGHPYVAYILFKLFNDVDNRFYKSRMENCIIQNNIVFGNSSSVVYMFSPVVITQNLINMKTNDPTNYAKICPVHNVFRDNIIWSGSSGTSIGRNYNLNTVLDGDNILHGNLLYIADTGNYYSSGVNKNRLNATSYIPATGDMIFNTNVGKPVWWKGSQWVDATGTAV